MGAKNGGMAVSRSLRPLAGSLRDVSERLDSASVSAVALRLTGHDHRVTSCLLAVPDPHAVVHGLLNTSTCMVLTRVSGKFWPGLVVGSCLTEYRKLDGQVLPEERLTRLRNRAKDLR